MARSMRKSSKSTTRGVCPRCGAAEPAAERFCSRCGMPLVAEGKGSLESPLSDAHARARKIDPAYTQGELVRVAGGRNLAEAELLQGMLLEEGVPSLLRRSAGFDVPDFLAAGPRDVLVPEAGARTAREVLLQTDLAPPERAAPRPNPVKLALVVLGVGALGTVAAWLLERAAG